MIGDGGSQEAGCPGNPQPVSLPDIDQAVADHGPADDVHGPSAEAPDQEVGEMVRPALGQVDNIFEGGETDCDGQGRT